MINLRKPFSPINHGLKIINMWSYPQDLSQTGDLSLFHRKLLGTAVYIRIDMSRIDSEPEVLGI